MHVLFCSALFSLSLMNLISAESIFYQWYNVQGVEKFRLQAWEEGYSLEKETFHDWKNRCTTTIEKQHSLRKLRLFNSSRLKSLCYSPLKYRVRALACREVVGLMSIEGHGNHAVRWALEQVTGVASASIYGDAAHLEALGIVWQKRSILQISSAGRAIVVKSHKGKILNRLAPYHKANSHKRTIIIVREPLGAILANYKRIGHLYKKPCSRAVLVDHKEGFTMHTIQLEDWDNPLRQQHFAEYARCEAKKWVKGMMFKSVLPQKSKNPILVIRYADLVSKTSEILTLLLRFLGIPIPLESQLMCASKVSKSTKRPQQANRTSPWDNQYPARSAALSAPGMCDTLRLFHYHALADEICEQLTS